MALFGRDYDRNMYGGYRGGYQGGYRTTGFGGGAYDREYGMYGNTHGTRGGYDRTYRGGTYGYGRGYDDNYKSRWQTDYGDPYGDRTSHTPFRMTRGEFHAYDRDMNYNRYDRDMRGTTPGYGYERDYNSANPMGYDPYVERSRTGYRAGTWDNGYRTGGYSGYNDRYDRGWF